MSDDHDKMLAELLMRFVVCVEKNTLALERIANSLESLPKPPSGMLPPSNRADKRPPGFMSSGR